MDQFAMGVGYLAISLALVIGLGYACARVPPLRVAVIVAANAAWGTAAVVAPLVVILVERHPPAAQVIGCLVFAGIGTVMWKAFGWPPTRDAVKGLLHKRQTDLDAKRYVDNFNRNVKAGKFAKY